MSYQPHPITWTPDRVDNLWRYYSSAGIEESAYFGMHSGQSILKFVRQHIPLQGREVLDFGCGLGHMLQYLLADGIPCQGLEFSEKSAEVARQRNGNHPLFKGVVLTQAVPTPLPEAAADVVLLIEVIEHLLDEQVESTLKELYRVLRPGGHVIVTTPHNENLALNMIHCPECGSTFHRWQHVRSLTVPSLSAFMQQAGFTPVLCQPTYFRMRQSLTGTVFNQLLRWYGMLRSGQRNLPHLIYIGRKA